MLIHRQGQASKFFRVGSVGEEEVGSGGRCRLALAVAGGRPRPYPQDTLQIAPLSEEASLLAETDM